MADMFFYTYSDKTKNLFGKKGKPVAQKISKTLESNVVAKMLSLNTLCNDYLSGFDASSADNWLGLMKKPVEVEPRYLVNAEGNEKWQKAYQKDVARLDKRYEEIVEGIKSKNLSPLKERAEIEKAVAKDPKMQRHVDNPIETTEIPLYYNRYMEGQNISFSETDATKDLQSLQQAVKSLKEQRILVKAMFDFSDASIPFSGFFGASVDQTIERIEAQAAVCLSGWGTVLTTLITGNGLSRQQAQRLVSRWVRTLRKLRLECGRLADIIRIAAPYLSYGQLKLREHILASSRTGTRTVTHRQIFYWCAKSYSEGNSGTLAKSYAANGFESTRWARDLYYKTDANYYDFPKENGKGYESPYIRGDKFDVVLFLDHHKMGHPETDDIDVRDLVLTMIDTPPANKLFTIIADYIEKPGAKTHTLEGDDSKL